MFILAFLTTFLPQMVQEFEKTTWILQKVDKHFQQHQ